MPLKDKVKTIERLKKEYDSLLPMKTEYRQKLDQKFMLEWNYNSNHIEGNTLTYGETKLLLVAGLTPGNHEMRELEEMKAHEVARNRVRDYALDKERPLNETTIRELNKIILVEPFWKEAKTPDGQPTQKKVIPGKYKSTPNNVETPTGEMFFFASPEETPALMEELLTWYEEAISAGHFDVWIAANLHYKFVRIHPFDDGNGRVARLLMNYHLLRTGYPPVVIKSAKKKEYLRSLRQADAGDKDGLFQHVADEMIWSLELSIKAARGQDPEEPEDWGKKVSIVARESEVKKKNRDKQAVNLKNQKLNAIYNNLDPFRDAFFKYFKPFERFYEKVSIRVYAYQRNKKERVLSSKVIDDRPKEEVMELFERKVFQDAIFGKVELDKYKFGPNKPVKLHYELNIRANDRYKVDMAKEGIGPWYFDWDYVLTEGDLHMMREQAEELLEELNKSTK